MTLLGSAEGRSPAPAPKDSLKASAADRPAWHDAEKAARENRGREDDDDGWRPREENGEGAADGGPAAGEADEDEANLAERALSSCDREREAALWP